MVIPTMKKSACPKLRECQLLILGMVLGSLINFEYGSQVVVNKKDSKSLERMIHGVSTLDSGDDPGWKSLHVYYGERSGLSHMKPNRKWFSQLNQDQIVYDLIGRNGYFIDLAANDAVTLSNTFALEQHGWKGLCIEPNHEYWYGLSHRQCQVVGAVIGGSKEQVKVQLNGVLGGIVDTFDERHAESNVGSPVTRYTAPILEVFTKFQVPQLIDYMSLDVEGAEMLIMRHFPFDNYRIKVLTVERPDIELCTLLEKNGYIFLKQLSWWNETLWAHNSTSLTPKDPKIQNIVTRQKKESNALEMVNTDPG